MLGSSTLSKAACIKEKSCTAQGICRPWRKYGRVEWQTYLELPPIKVAILVPVKLLEEVLDIQRVLGCSHPSPCHPLTHRVQGPQSALVPNRQILAVKWHV